MKATKMVIPNLQRVVAEAECPYCGYNCFYEFTQGIGGHLADDFDADVCDHCVDYDAYEFIFEKEVNGLQRLQEIKNERRQDDTKDRGLVEPTGRQTEEKEKEINP